VTIGSIDTPSSARSVSIAGNVALVSDYNSGLQAIDVSDPAHPALLGFWNTPSRAYGAGVVGSLAFVAGYEAGLQVVDISDCNQGPCPADCDLSSDLSLFDFLCFVNLFNANDPAADCEVNGVLDLFDFLCFVNTFNAGC
jgi:hypothetical protein